MRPGVGKRAAWIATGALLLTAIAGGFAWYVWFSSAGYEPPPDYAAIESGRTHDVFVYGTLRFDFVRRIVIGRAVETRTAILPGYRKSGLDIVPEEDGQVQGGLFEVSADELRRLDRYERAGVRYDRARLELEDGTLAWVYQRIR